MIKRNPVSRIHHLLFTNEYESARVLLALSSLFWSFFFLYPGDAFSNPVYSKMGAIATEVIWSLLFAIYSVLGAYSVFYGVCTRFFRIFIPLFGFVLWGATSLCIIFSDSPIPPAIGSVIGATVVQWWILVRVRA